MLTLNATQLSGVRYLLANREAVCKFLVTEILSRLQETKSSDTLNVRSVQGDSKKVKYETSELRLYEVLEDPPICNRLLQYKVHKERQDSSRFDKGTPQTMKSLTELVNRGVDVKLDVPFELWDKPPAEVTALFKETNLLKGAWMKNLQINQNILQNHTSRMSYNLCTTHWRHS
ncbi:Protein canopy 3 [Schistosoma haematobium]|uniref:Protein canopy 3 n=1 Tax=Schistosoma haematobium TaxID=6185 RepID=A0A922LRN7_SCHHA|nr:Protein canopy 3 [Schistosoma haematobium]KAH9592062.1 Protein canopy 3 [Schistosoma haematobium]